MEHVASDKPKSVSGPARLAGQRPVTSAMGSFVYYHKEHFPTKNSAELLLSVSSNPTEEGARP